MGVLLAPQKGPQTAFLASRADVVLYGGAAGGGKSHGLLLEGARHHDVPGFAGVIFRRTTPQITNAGGLWEKSFPIMLALKGRPRGFPKLEWRFPSSATLGFAHLERDADVHSWAGSELALIGLDEASHFTRKQIVFLFSRNRSTSGVAPYMRMTTNPDPDAFIAEFVDPYYLDDEGYAHPDKAGIVRYFALDDGDKLVQGATAGEVKEQAPHLFDDDTEPLSFAFIPSKLDDNPALTSKDPGYKGKLKALSYVQRMRLEKGNWRIRESAGTMFRAPWFEIVEDWPRDAHAVRYWDLAGSKRSRSDFTAGALVAFSEGRYWVVDVRNQQGRPLETERLIRSCAELDGRGVSIYIEQETGSAGAIVIDHYQRNVLPGYSVEGAPVRGLHGKIERAKPSSSAAEAGNIKVVRAPWNREFLDQLEAFPDGKHDDMVDALSGGVQHAQQGGFYWRSV